MSDRATRKVCGNEKELQVWDRLELEFEEKEQKGEYITRVEDLAEIGVVVARPEWISGEPLLKNGAICSVTFVRPTCAYGFSAKIKRLPRNGQREFYLLSHPRSVKRIQRRRYVRVDVSLPFKFKVLEELSEEVGFDEIEWEEAITRNLSAGGVGFECDRRLDADVPITVAIEIPEREKIVRSIARIARIIEEEEGRYLIGLEILHNANIQSAFKSLKLDRIPDRYKRFSDKDRNDLANFVFAEEVAIRRRNMV